MAEEATDVTTQAATQETAPTESSPVETKTPEVADPVMDGLKDEDASDPEPEKKDAPEKETESDPKEEQVESESQEEPTEETEEEGKPRGKQDANTRIRALANENRQLKEQINQLNSQVYRPQSEQDLMNDGMNPTDARVEALRQQYEVDTFNRQVTELNTTMNQEADAVMRDFPMFDPESAEYSPEVAERANALYQRSAGMQVDPNTGLLISANVSPYDFYKTIAETYEVSSRAGQLKGQKATEQMMASTDARSSAAPKTPKVDPIMAGLLSDD